VSPEETILKLMDASKMRAVLFRSDIDRGALLEFLSSPASIIASSYDENILHSGLLSHEKHEERTILKFLKSLPKELPLKRWLRNLLPLLQKNMAFP